ncbi:excisionase family DNA binding protein [Pseudomonas aeruginosa]|nr:MULTISPECIES: helix-turn-helix domain-containing protein [Pseudomonas]MBG5252885.1 helix-turn-helix domain-containing protein [Pseudomonas aeruginosa]MCP1569809.1 excisionase family DNA binding protein [Pseudomonas aeruginosa]MCW5246094.1 helix-turn-helix domain-containing protein [Pseudomonas aeruginosa]MCW5280486.1 helix-turn-helix domain-containing protein [Pseudomonas aeruginosa]MDI2482887.1 helix-turn-helix domain-containing protein [Pseudomonas aeruginosa]
MHPDSTTAHTETLWTPERAAHALGVSIRTLASWRSTGRHALPYVKIGRLVRYREHDVHDWLQSHLQHKAGGER